MSIHPDFDTDKVWGTYFTASFDGGYTWENPREISDSSVTPHIVALKNDYDAVKKEMLLIEINKKSLKNLTTLIKKVDASAFLMINETKVVHNGIIK